MAEQNLAHNVYFTLKDDSKDAIDSLVQDCFTYLKDNEGIISFYAGKLVPENNREVNVTDFQVGLHIIFRSKADHDRYQESKNHKLFVEKNKPNWSKSRVFDTYV